MTLFTVIYCRRSDGKLEVMNKSRAREKNEPTKDQLDPRPNAKGVSDYYRPLGMNDSKHLDWRRKLAGMLVKEVGGKEFSIDKAYILDDLPENYRLYEHVKTKPEDATSKSGKTHAGGGNDRQDAYLYGHPGGRKKRYRSPADFFPHLLWLCTDDSGDMNNCACKVCSPDEIQADVKPANAPARGGTVSMKVESQQVTGRNPVVEIPVKSTTPTTARPAPSPAVPKATSPKQAQRQPAMSGPPAPTNIDQQLDTTYNRLSFRLGELVWFNSGPIWALGVTIRRWTQRDRPLPQAKRYLIQPLAAPFQPQTPLVIEAESQLRPWLAWSPPPFCHPNLNQAQSVTFGNMDWGALVGGRYGQSNNDIVKVDASILAARAIDASYTPFGFLSATPVANVQAGANVHHSTHKIQWNGLFLGGERIWVGDAVRLRLTANEDVLVVSQIEERPQPQTPGQPNTAPSKILLIGNIYSLASTHAAPTPADQANLIPSRMREDLLLRNAASAVKSHWKPLRSGQAVEISQVKGRWYETSIMAPIVNGNGSWEECVRSGRGDSVSRSFNGRVELGGGSPGERTSSREKAFGRSVPENTKLVDGISEPQAGELPGQQQQPQAQAQQAPAQSDFDAQMQDHDQQGDGLDQFMDFSTTEGGDSMPGFGQDYSSQDTFFR